jgi:hypothetical protein
LVGVVVGDVVGVLVGGTGGGDVVVVPVEPPFLGVVGVVLGVDRDFELEDPDELE